MQAWDGYAQYRSDNNSLQKTGLADYPPELTVSKLSDVFCGEGSRVRVGEQRIRFLLSHLFSLRLVVAGMALLVILGGASLPVLPTLDRTIFDLVLDAQNHEAGTESATLSDRSLIPLLKQRSIVTPDWSGYALTGLLTIGALFLIVAMPSLGIALSALTVALGSSALVATQALLIVYRNLWLPLGMVTLFLLAGFVVMLFWMQPHREIRTLTRNACQARLQLARLLLIQGQTDESLGALTDCPEHPEKTALLYDIAIQQERKRQYDSAVRTYNRILTHNRQYRDVKDRLHTLAQLVTGAPLSVGGSFEATRTLVMPDQAVSKPTLGRYEIERELGRGAMGVVYLGKDPKIARTVAIKTLSYDQFDAAQMQDLKARFFREAEAAGRLNHPDIVTVYDVGEEADLAFIAMDYADGKPLSAFGKPKSLLQIQVVLELVARVAEALDYAHGQKVIHRDIKPGNIIYNQKSGALKITDFGIAKLADDSRTRTGSVMGSPLYMSPEQLKGQKVTGASDIYSLGVTLYKLISGQTPYQGDTLANLTYQILNKRPKSIREHCPELPDSVVRLINKAIQREPSKRFASASAMADALRRAVARESTREVS